MIWAPDDSERQFESEVVSHLTSEIDVTCRSVLSTDASAIRELAKAVDAYLREKGENYCVDSQYVLMLASRALDSIGEGEAAKRLLLFGSGLVKPSEWDVSGGETVWVVDLRQLTLREDAPIELVFFASLSMILDCIAEVWDESSGKGILGLRHICSAVCDLVGDSNVKRRKKLAAEIKDVCGRRLEQMKCERKWTSVPEVIDLDV